VITVTVKAKSRWLKLACICAGHAPASTQNRTKLKNETFIEASRALDGSFMNLPLETMNTTAHGFELVVIMRGDGAGPAALQFLDA
jgi:hypothetical protein